MAGGKTMKRLGVLFAEITLMIFAATRGQAAGLLSQWAPLNASRLSTFGENYTESEIHRNLQALPDFSAFDYLAFTVDGNTVLLYGKVLNSALRRSAASVAATAQGVSHVINHITLLQDSPSENHIRLAVLGAIYSDPRLARYASIGSGGAIHIVVEGGTVTLEGEVALVSDARRVVERVGAVPHVLKIANHLAIGN
jgi:hypothetical protein